MGTIIISYWTVTWYDLKNKETNIYYKQDNVLPLDYDKARVHVLRNDKFEVRTYYFMGLNELSYMIQDKAMEKLNNKKVLKKSI